MIGFALLGTSDLQAQEVQNPFELFRDKKEFIFGLDNRRTHIYHQSTTIYGAYMGVGFGGKLRFKAGVSGTPFEVGEVITDDNLAIKNRLFFFNVGEEFDFLYFSKLRFTTYVQLGWGYNYFRELDPNGLELFKGRKTIVPLELGLHSSYDFLPWLNLKLGGGWRFVFPFSTNNLSGYYFKVGLGFNTKKFISSYRDWRSKRAEQATL